MLVGQGPLFYSLVNNDSLSSLLSNGYKLGDLEGAFLT